MPGGHYDPATGLYRSPGGCACFYYASDNIQNERYRRLYDEAIAVLDRQTR